MKSAKSCALGWALCCLWVASAQAQAVRLPSAGTQLVGVTQGRFPLRGSAPNCRGYGLMQPNHILQVNDFSPQMQIAAQSPTDTTLIVQLPNGQVVCDDDSGGSNNPLVTFETQRGQIRVWVGTYSEGANAQYRLSVSPVGGVRPEQGRLDPRQPSRFEGAELQSGFQPQVLVLRGTFGGPVSATTLEGSCTGYAESPPNHVFTARTAFSNLRFLVNGDNADTTLIVQYPDGRVVCNDDADGRHPVVEGPTRGGVFRVWVGGYSFGETGSYRIAVTEQPGLRPSDMPQTSTVLTTPTVVQPPIVQPPVQPVVVAPTPSRPSTAIELLPRIPVTVFGPDIPDATLALWSPRTGEALEVGVRRNSDGTLTAYGRVNGNPITIDVVVPQEFQNAVVTLTERPDGRLLVRADNFAGGRSAVFLVDWQNGLAAVNERWAGSLRGRAPRWAR